MDPMDDEFLFTLNRVKAKLASEAGALKQVQSLARSERSAENKAAEEVTGLRAALAEKEKEVFEKDKRLLVLESDAKVNGGRGGEKLLRELTDLKTKVLSLSKAATVHDKARFEAQTEIKSLETSLAEARAEGLKGSAIAREKEAEDEQVGAGTDALKQVARKYKKQAEELESCAVATSTELATCKDQLALQAASLAEFKTALGEAHRLARPTTVGGDGGVEGTEVPAPEKIERVVELSMRVSKLEEQLVESEQCKRTAQAQAQAADAQVVLVRVDT